MKREKILSFLNIKKWPPKGQWKHFFGVLSRKEKILLSIFVIIALASIVFLVRNFYLENTVVRPAKGGTHIEGVTGQPRFVNPLYANSEVDRALTQLLFSGLMKYDKDLKIVPDLVERYKIEESGKVYKFYLKEDLKWQDEEPLTADDVVFTIKRIQDSAYKSPLMPNWVGVEVEKIGDLAVKFEIEKPYNAFIENCTVKILPKHIWEKVSAENFPLEIYNLKPIGSGPYKIKEIKQEKPNQIDYLTLSQNSLYHGPSPNISEIKFLFTETEEEIINAARSKKITGFSASISEIVNEGWEKHGLFLPRYFAVFFNPEQNEIFKEKNVREALALSVNKEEVVGKLGIKNASDKITSSPLLPDIYGLRQPSSKTEFDLEKARSLLEEAGFEEKDGIMQKEVDKERAFTFERDLVRGDEGMAVEELQNCLAKFPEIYPDGEITAYFGPKTEEAVKRFQEKYKEDILSPWGFSEGNGKVRETTKEKLNEVCFEEPETIVPLKFSLITVNQSKMAKLAELLKEQWAKIGVEVSVHKADISHLEQNYIKPRDYNALLFGEVLGAIPDPFPFWHSSQKKDPGLNLALFESQEADELMEEIRQNPDPEENKEKLEQLQDIIIAEKSAIFLYSPDYDYFVSKEIKNISSHKITDPSKRFVDIENWYIKTKREWK